jgi:hypothetical protein
MKQADLKRVISRAEREALSLAQKQFGCCKVFSFGAVDIDPKNLAVWTTTDTDAQRDELLSSGALINQFRVVFRAAGYPESAVLDIRFEFESQQTVDRDFNGNWWHAVK